MKQTIHFFNPNHHLSEATAQLFHKLKVPLKRGSDMPFILSDVLGAHTSDLEQYTQAAYFVGAIGGDTFEDTSRNPDITWSAHRADCMLVFALEISRLNEKQQQLMPTRRQLFDLAHAFSRMFPTQPVILVFRYGSEEYFISMAICDQKQSTKKAKMSLLRDVNVEKPQEAHLRILRDLEIPRQGKNAIDSFETLYQYWLEKLNVSALNKKFYNELSNWYFWALKNVRFPNEPTDIAQLEAHRANNVIRLITRLIFTWFLKEKKLVSEAIFDMKTLKDKILFDSDNPVESNESTYYQAVLQNLFFATLNQEMKDRRFRKITEWNKHIYHYAYRFKNPRFATALFDETPFLNGGLFECLDKEDFAVDGFSDDATQQAYVPNFLFFQSDLKDWDDLNKVYDTKNKKYKVRGILSILKDYKFTIAENTPLEQEIALDPELLGHVFENLLASYNPETQVTARKQTGSFYTPREIVNYMVDESLIAYLQNALQLNDNESIRLLFDNTSQHALEDTTVFRLIDALNNCKMLDPACGSGAFPIGILNRMVQLLHKLDPYNHYWKAAQLKKVASIDIDSVREAAIKAIEIAFESNEGDYARKLYLIQNCIYGVDIQPIAVQIAKLRCFISLLCDQKVKDLEDNRGVVPLPNLETKFVAANTLMGLERMNLAKMAVEAFMEKRAHLRHRLFSEKRPEAKKQLRYKDEQLRHQIKAKLDKLSMGGQAEQLASWNPFDQSVSAPFFDADWMFHVKEGFDLVIGNPPYVEHKKLKAFSVTFKKQFSTYAGTADLYVYFYEHGLRNLKEKGNLCFITSNKFIKTEYGKNIRAYFAKNKIRQIINFSNIHVFDALVASCILMVEKNLPNKQSILWVNTNDDMAKIGLNAFVEKNQIWIEQEKLKPELWLLEKDSKAALKLLIEKKSQTIENTKGIAVYRGVTTGYNPAFIIDEDTRKALIKGDAKNDEIIKPLLQGRNIRKWIYETSGLHLIFTKQGINIHHYGLIETYLKTFHNELKPRQINEIGGRKSGAYQWYEIQDNTAYYPEFSKEKIIWGLTADKWAFAYDDKGHYLPSNGYILTSDTIPIKYLLALLNSKVMKYYFGFIGIMTAGGAYTLKHSSIQALPIKIIVDTPPFVTLVDYLLNKQTSSTPIYICNYFEQIIDAMVCELYFEAEMKSKQLNIMELVSSDFAMQTNGVKMQLMEQLYQNWNAPAHEIKKRLDLMPVRSPDILGVILKR